MYSSSDLGRDIKEAHTGGDVEGQFLSMSLHGGNSNPFSRRSRSRSGNCLGYNKAMRYRLRTLLIIGTIGTVLILILVWFSTPPDPNVPRDPAAKKATDDIRELLHSAMSLEVVEAGDAVVLRSRLFQTETLHRLAEAATIIEVEVTNVPRSIVANAYIKFRIKQFDDVLQEYHFLYHDSLVDNSKKDEPEGYWTILRMSPTFSRIFLNELTENFPPKNDPNF